MTEKTTKPGTDLAVKTNSGKFTEMVIREFSASAGTLVPMDEYHKKLAQHLFIKIDATMAELEIKRQQNPKKKNNPPIVWENVNLQKCAISAVHRIDLGLDALIPNHVHPIPYLNGRTKKYDLDLRVGYVGKDYYRREMALDRPFDVIYELVYSNDGFKPIKRSATNKFESYELEIPNPFDRGDVIGGFGYVMYEDQRKNQLVLITMADFNKSKSQAGSDKFWNGHQEMMMLKTVVNRTTDKIPLDPRKICASLLSVENEMPMAEAQLEDDIAENANKDIIDIEIEDDPDKIRGQDGPPPVEKEKKISGKKDIKAKEPTYPRWFIQEHAQLLDMSMDELLLFKEEELPKLKDKIKTGQFDMLKVIVEDLEEQKISS